MKELIKKAKVQAERGKALALGFLRGELGRVGPARVRPATALTLIWLQAVFGSVEEAFAPLMEDEPSVERLVHILAILDVSTDKRCSDYRRARKRIERLREKLARMSASDVMRGAGLLVMAFEGMKGASGRGEQEHLS
ncbi:MAG: hypothetical protein ABIM59_01160 [candidate division WOR-3 bacterium]